MTSEGALRRTTDLPAQRAPRSSIDLSAVAQRYATPLRLAYLACIGIATLLHLGVDLTPANLRWRLHRAIDPGLGFRDVVDAARNVALFLGWGATWVLTARPPTRGRDVVRATLWGMTASLTVESIQLLSQYRTASIADVVTNTLGSLLGAAALWLVERRATEDMRRGTAIGIPGWLPAGALALTAFGLAFAPSSRASVAMAWAASPLERARQVAALPAIVVPWPALVTDAVLWTAVGLTVAVAISDRTGRIRPAQLLSWLVIVPVLIAVAHTGRSLTGLQSEDISWQVQAAAATIGLGIGLGATPRWRSAVTARSTRALHLGVLVAAVGTLMSWYPARWAIPAGGTTFSWRQLVPMMSLFQRQDLSSVFLVLQKAGLGAALGACLAARKRVGEPRPGVRAALGYASLLEAGQFLVPGRYPDVTDILITGASACLAAVLVERADRTARDTQPPDPVGLNGLVPAGRL